MCIDLGRIQAEHQFIVARTETSFKVLTGDLRPYPLGTGNWAIVPQHLSSDGDLTGTGRFSSGFQLFCYETISGNNEPLSILTFKTRQFEEDGNVVVFDPPSRPFLLNQRSNVLHFQLRTLNGEPVTLSQKGELLFGFALLQLVD